MLFCRVPRPSGVVLVLRWGRGSASCPQVLRTRRSRGAACGGASWAFVFLVWGDAGSYLFVRLHAFARRSSSGAACLLVVWSCAPWCGAGGCRSVRDARFGQRWSTTDAWHRCEAPGRRAATDWSRAARFCCPDGASEFSARFEEQPCIFRLVTAWQAPGTCRGKPEPNPNSTARGITLQRSEFASC